MSDRERPDNDMEVGLPPVAERNPPYTGVTWSLGVIVGVMLGLILSNVNQPLKSTSSSDHRAEIPEAVKNWMDEQRTWIEKTTARNNGLKEEFQSNRAEIRKWIDEQRSWIEKTTAGINGLKEEFKSNRAEIPEAVKKWMDEQRSWIEKTTARNNGLKEEFKSNNSFSCSYCSTTFTSCEDVLKQFPGSPSAYYYIITSNGRPVHVYCDMTLTCGNITGGWRRVGYLSTSEDEAIYSPQFIPNGVISCKYSKLPHGCSSQIFHNFGISYTFVCGKINAFQETSHNGFKYKDCPVNPTLDSNYVDGVSLTHNDNGVRSHIWTLAAEANCHTSKTGVPEFVGNYFSIDSGNRAELLWDDVQCPDSPSNSSAWFYRKLQQSNHDDIEMRVCGNQPQDDLLLTNVEIYVY